MKGLVKVTPDSLINLIEYCMDYMGDFDPTIYPRTEYKKWSWSKLKWIDSSCLILPSWHGYKSSLTRHFHELHDMALNAGKNGDEIWLSELSYKNMVLLKNGNEDANPIFIMNY